VVSLRRPTKAAIAAVTAAAEFGWVGYAKT
jgi:hypothetical protein